MPFSRSSPPWAPRPLRRQPLQRGIAALWAAIILTILATLATLNSSRFLVFEQVISGNQARATQAFEAAQYGIDRGVAWLQARSSSPVIDNWSATNVTSCKENTSVNSSTGLYSIYSLEWSTLTGNSRVVAPAATCNLNIPTTLTVSMGNVNYDVSLSYVQNISNLGDLSFLTIVATSQSQDTFKGGSARIEQVVSIPLGPLNGVSLANSPLVIKGCLPTDNGNPDICPSGVSAANATITGGSGAPNCEIGSGSPGIAITTLATEPANPDDCIDLSAGKLSAHSGTRQFLNRPTASVWETLFPNNRLTEPMVKSLAEAGVPGFVYYDSSNAPSGKLPNLGTSSQPVLVYVDSSAGCMSLSPGEFFAMAYYETTGNCDLNGGGGADFTGTLAVEGSINKFGANTIFRQSNFTGIWEQQVGRGALSFSRVPGGWRDFQ